MAVMAIAAAAPTVAGEDTVQYKPDLVQAAIAKGAPVLLHYKSTW